MRRRFVAMTVALGPALALATAVPAMAGTWPARSLPAVPTSHSRSTTTTPDLSTSALAGFAQVSDSGGVDHSTSYSSVGGAITVTPEGTGLYQVDFGGLAFPGGDVQITDPAGTSTCSVDSWGPSSSDLLVNVGCYDATGALANEPFNILVTQPHTTGTRPNGVFDYDWVYKANGRLTGIYQFNSAHRTNSVRHLGTGRYLVTMPGPGASGASKGTVKVSPYGTGGGNCQVASWRTTSAGEQVGVTCFTAVGVPLNRRFTIVYARSNNLMGQNGKLDANAFANGTKALYQPAVQFDSKPGARVSIVHLDRGIYEVLFVGTNPTHHFSGGFGHLQLTTAGHTYVRCGIALIPLHQPFALMDCTTASGTLTNTSFIVQLVFN